MAAQQARDQATYQDGLWGRITHAVMARPALFVVFSAGLLIACAIPYFDLNPGTAGIETQPPSDVRTAYHLLATNFSAGLVGPVEIVIDCDVTHPVTQSSIENLYLQLALDSSFGPVTITSNPQGTLTLLSTPLKVDSICLGCICSLGFANVLANLCRQESNAVGAVVAGPVLHERILFQLSNSYAL